MAQRGAEEEFSLERVDWKSNPNRTEKKRMSERVN